MNISVIIPTYNRVEQIGMVLDCFVKQDYPKDLYEILVIDNNSTDNTKTIVLEYCNNFADCKIKYVFEPIPGLISGRHRGAKESSGEILIFCDDDIQVESSALKIVEKTFELNSKIGLVGGKYLPNYQVSPPEWLDAFWDSTPYKGKSCGALSLLDLGDELLEIDACYVWGLFYAIRRDILFECGGFHPDACPIPYFRGDGETGLSEEIKKRNIISLYNPALVIKHDVSENRMSKKYFLNRHYSQGISDSYTDIRKGKRDIESFTNKKYLRIIKRFLSEIKALLTKGHKAFFIKRLKNKCDIFLKKGYCFHNNVALNNTEILHWVLKPDYWDYKYPSIQTLEGVTKLPDSNITLHR